MAPVKNKSFWLSYDFGLRGNYSGLFNLLDNFNAKECGNGLAYFRYSNANMLTDDELIAKLKSEILEKIAPADSDRIYVIWREGDEVKGRFICGKRKQAPWVGYGNKSNGDDATDEG